MKDFNIKFPLDKFEKLIKKIGWESLDDWINFCNTHRDNFAIYEFWDSDVKDDWIWGLALPLLSQA